MSMGSVILAQTWESCSIEHGNTAREREKGSFGLFDQIVLTQERRDQCLLIWISHPTKRKKQNEQVMVGRKKQNLCITIEMDLKSNKSAFFSNR